MKRLLLIFTMILLVLVNIRSWACPTMHSAYDHTTSMATPGFLATSLNIDGLMISEHATIKRDLSQALKNFRASRDFGEARLQTILQLLNLELTIVDSLLYGYTGAFMERIVAERNHFIAQTTPSVAFIYDKIMDMACYDDELNKKLYIETRQRGRSLRKALNRDRKKNFLYTMRDKLEHYAGVVKQMQCALSIAPSTKNDHIVEIGSLGEGVGFCPIIK